MRIPYHREDIHFDAAPSPAGPWTTAAVDPVTGDDSNGANSCTSFDPTDDRAHTIAVGHTRSDGELPS